jgi:hypothetical protein
MAQTETRKLDAGDPFPEFTLDVLDTGRIPAKAALGGSWSVLLLYRGHW